MSVKRLLAVGFIMGCTAVAWFVLGSALTLRTQQMDGKLEREVAGNWGTSMVQQHPLFYYISPTSAQGHRGIQPLKSTVNVDLNYDPKKKGLIWYRTYVVDFDADYVVRNPTPIRQTIYARFNFPASGIRYDNFVFQLGERKTDKAPVNGEISESVILGPGEEVPVKVIYRAAGMGRWDYSLAGSSRVRGFDLKMATDFREINIPAGAESPTSREMTERGWALAWNYTDVIGARSVGMDMPAVVNPGPVAARISFFAPVSLLFFFSVLLIVGMVRRVDLHPMNYFFLAAGCFAFHLLFAYLVDLIPAMVAFLVSAGVSLVLVTGYLWGVAGGRFARISAVAQLAYMVLFSYSFFFRGLTGITITAGAIATLALLMIFTARVDWSEIFRARVKPLVPPELPDEASA